MLHAKIAALSSPSNQPDPLDPDAGDDEAVVVTRRRLIRLALVASEVGARFERDRIGHDPMAWMLAPRRMFCGAAPLDACQDLAGCTGALLLHGLGLGLDASAEEIADLIADEHDDSDDRAAPLTSARILKTGCLA